MAEGRYPGAGQVSELKTQRTFTQTRGRAETRECRTVERTIKRAARARTGQTSRSKHHRQVCVNTRARQAQWQRPYARKMVCWNAMR